MPEIDLAAAIIYAAVADALIDARRAAERGRRGKSPSISFCTDETGAWAASREMWCDAAGVDADALREQCVARLNAAKITPLRAPQVRDRARLAA